MLTVNCCATPSTILEMHIEDVGNVHAFFSLNLVTLWPGIIGLDLWPYMVLIKMFFEAYFFSLSLHTGGTLMEILTS